MKPLIIVETNFIVQVATGRDDLQQAWAAEEILRRAQEETITLAVPAFSILEAESTLRQASKRRNRLADGLASEEKELRRGPLSAGAGSDLSAFRASLTAVSGQEGANFDRFIKVAVEVGLVIPLPPEAILRAREYQLRQGLPLADGAILASALMHLDVIAEETSLRIFLSYNKRDFDQEFVHDLLGDRGCEYHSDARAVIAALERVG